MLTIASVLQGDWNENAAAVAALAKRAGATFVQGHHVDHAIVAVTGDAEVKVLEVTELAKGGSDHPALLIRLSVDGHEIVLLDWNVYVGQKPARVSRRLRALIRKHKPDAITLQEAYHCGPVLAVLAEKVGYHLIQGPNVGEGADCAVLMRGDHSLRHHGRKRMRQRWTGPKHNLPKQPREVPFGRARIAPSLVLRVGSIHQATGGPEGRNGASVVETQTWAVRWLTQPEHVTHRRKKENR